MSVLIKCMDMPEGCLAFDPDKACPCFNSEYGECAIVRKELKYGEVGRPSWCPLVEVPTPHGRLIDADAFAKTVKDISIRQGYDKLTFDNLTVDDVLDSVIVELNGSGLDGYKNAPTVIEAEE